ncbi:uncharacterized protein METZ01_LOCUS109699 [marine metagenome]|uniref:Uncharacterized protein n=1 Tax=marine metagenome TaxID=408172 RepID=A0A381WWD8_9ZZZZ
MNSSPSSSRMILDIASAISSCFIPLDSNSAQDSSIVLRSFSFENISSNTATGTLKSFKR